jgi:uncharacterized protein YcgI (DUF1989 family)
MPDEALMTIPARRGKAARATAGQHIAVINTHGEQVVDTWAFAADDLHEFMSMEHTRAALGKLIPRTGDILSTNHRRPILTIVEDTSPGIHDTLIAACDLWRYQGLGCKEYHDNCTDNLHAAMKELGLKAPETPSPLNLFMNIPWKQNGEITFEAPVTKPGDTVTFRAERDLVIAFSACPQDMLPINGVGKRPTEANFRIF